MAEEKLKAKVTGAKGEKGVKGKIIVINLLDCAKSARQTSTQRRDVGNPPRIKKGEESSGGEGEEEELNFIDLGALEMSEDQDHSLPPVPREASGLSFAGHEVLSLGGTIGYYTDFYKKKKFRSEKTTTAWKQPQPGLQQDSCSCPPLPSNNVVSNHNQARGKVGDRSTTGPALPSVGIQYTKLVLVPRGRLGINYTKLVLVPCWRPGEGPGKGDLARCRQRTRPSLRHIKFLLGVSK